MPRIARIHAPATIVHVISRFVNGEFLIRDDDAREAYLDRLETRLSRVDWILLAYAVMNSHTHLALLAGTDLLREWVQGLNTSVAAYIQRRRRWAEDERVRGPVFADRPNVVLIPPERAAYLMAYLHNNPVRAAVVRHASESTWTSHRAFVGLEPPVRCLDVERGLELSGFGSSPEGFADIVRAHAGDPRDPTLSAGNSRKVATAARAQVGASVHLGTPTLGSNGPVFPLVQSPSASPVLGFTGSATQVVTAVATVACMPVNALTRRGGTHAVACFRRIAVHTWHRMGRRPSEMADALQRSRSAVAQVLAEPAPARFEVLLPAILRELKIWLPADKDSIT